MPETRETTLPIAQLSLSPHNVRVDERDTSNTEALEASILAEGLLQALNVHPMRGSRDKFGVFAGGRRYRSIKALIGRGDLPTDWAVKVTVYEGYSDAQLIELSIGENMLRRDLRPYELFAGVRKAHAKGDSVEAIAATLGQEPKKVAKWLRIGEIARPIFEAFRAEQISIDEVEAYGATADVALQLSVFQELMPLEAWHRTPEKIRRALKVGDVAAARLLRFVGLDGYRAAGGRFEYDLFADEADERGRVVDDGILRQLADARFADTREETRALVGRELRFVPHPPRDDFNGTDWNLQITPRPGDDDAIVLPDGDVVGWIDVTEDGEPRVTYWWASRQAKFGDKASRQASAPKASGADAIRDPHHYAAPAKAAVKEEHGVSSDATEIIRSLRRELLRALLIEDARRGGDLGRDFLVWAQLRSLLTRDPATGAASPSIGDTFVGLSVDLQDKARGHLEQHIAHDVWSGAVREVAKESFIVEPDLAAAFMDYRNAGAGVKQLAGAVLAGSTLARSANAPGFRLSALDALAGQARGTSASIVRRLWSPTAEFLELLPKAQLLAIAEPIVGPDTYKRWEKVKSAELPGLLAQALAGGGNAVAERNRKAAAEWVHPLLAFRELDFSKAAPSIDADELAEAAE